MRIVQYVNRWLVIATLVLVPSHAYSASDACLEGLRAHFEKTDPQSAKTFFNLQAKLTLHRLAWAYLDAQEKKNLAPGQKLSRVEDSIAETMLDIATQSQSPEFSAARDRFLAAPLSRVGLAEATQSIRQIVQAQSTDVRRPYTLHVEDIKMISLLSELEGQSADPKASLFVQNPRSNRSVLNLLKIINSAYTGSTHASIAREKATVDREIDRLTKLQEAWGERLTQALKQVPQCSEVKVCSDCVDGSSDSSENAVQILIQALSQGLRDNQFLGVKYGDVWLRTSKSYPLLEVESTTDENDASHPLRGESANRPSASRTSENSHPVPTQTPTRTPPPAIVLGYSVNRSSVSVKHQETLRHVEDALGFYKKHVGCLQNSGFALTADKVRAATALHADVQNPQFDQGNVLLVREAKRLWQYFVTNETGLPKLDTLKSKAGKHPCILEIFKDVDASMLHRYALRALLMIEQLKISPHNQTCKSLSNADQILATAVQQRGGSTGACGKPNESLKEYIQIMKLIR